MNGPNRTQTGQTRVDLAAAYRLADLFGLNEGIFNHLTVLLPDRGCILSQPIGMHWSEVTASSLLEVDLDGRVVSGEGEVERSTVCIHMPIHRAFEGARCVFHTHMPFASTLTRLRDPRLRPTGQTEIRFWNRIAYDDGYNGLVYDMAEGERLAAILGPRNHVLREIPTETIDRTRHQLRESPLYYGKPGHELHFSALKRMLDRRNPGYEG
jgi:ribulose-5-phosphate 4-epimerase/fuculose-1-phosphate aldolase